MSNIGPTKKHSGSVGTLAMLRDINHALTVERTPRAGFQRALAILERNYGIARGAIVVANPDTGRLRVEASCGVVGVGQNAEWKADEGITGRVVTSGKPVVITQISKEPSFLHRTGQRAQGSRSETSFICVPIFGTNQSVGALNIDFPFDKDRNYDFDLHV